MGEGEESATQADEYIKQPTPGLTTVVVPPAPRQDRDAQARVKKDRDREYQRRKRASLSQRSTSDEEATTASISSRRPTKRTRLADDD